MVTAGTKSVVSRSLEDWTFTQVGGGQGTKDGEWLKVSSFPTTVHVELMKLGKIPDPVSLVCCSFITRLDVDIIQMSSVHRLT
jgi:hypothetical protein